MVIQLLLTEIHMYSKYNRTPPWVYYFIFTNQHFLLFFLILFINNPNGHSSEKREKIVAAFWQKKKPKWPRNVIKNVSTARSRQHTHTPTDSFKQRSGLVLLFVYRRFESMMLHYLTFAVAKSNPNTVVTVNAFFHRTHAPCAVNKSTNKNKASMGHTHR